jgi:hypothetical protein
MAANFASLQLSTTSMRTTKVYTCPPIMSVKFEEDLTSGITMAFAGMEFEKNEARKKSEEKMQGAFIYLTKAPAYTAKGRGN